VTTRPRTPGIVYSALSVVVLVVLGAVAFSTRQPPPPSIAEFAPNAVEKIEDAPEEQRAGEEEGVGACPADEPDCDAAATPTPQPGADPDDPEERFIDVPRVRKCIGDPPRQIEDPQSPPCVPYWEGENGGATYKGVTKDEIRIAMPNDCPSIERCKLTEIENSARFFNRRFEFYGRKIVIVNTADEAICDDDDPAGSRATAQAADEQHHVFGSIECGSGDPEYSRELARRGLIFVAHESPFGVIEGRRSHPHIWQYPMEPESIFAHFGEWACKRVAGGGTARHAGPLLRDEKRVFGVVLTPFTGADIKPDELTDRLEGCGAPPRLVINESGPDHTNVILQMKNAGVTSVFCLCHMLELTAFGRAATAQAYFPEWLISSYDINHYNTQIKTGLPAEQREHAFGIQVMPMQQRAEDWPGVWMCKEVDPQCDTSLPAVGPYHAMLLLASGIQMAGPNLTPDTFAEGLAKTAFPNPDHPILAGDVGFNEPIAKPDPKYSPAANLPHGMTSTGIEFWWSESATGPNSEEGNGAMCYVARKRFRLGEYPKGGDDVFFEGECDSGGV
jgi:hypothetical protein